MIAVVGPGAVGGLVAALLARAGQDVVVVGREARVAEVQAHGIRVRSPALGTWTSQVNARTSVPPGSAVVLAVKAFALPDVLPLLEAGRPAEVLSLLNGLDHARELAQSPHLPRTAGASVTVEALRVGAAVEHRSPFLRVTVPGAASDWETVTALRAAGVEVLDGGSEAAVLWAKLRFLAPMALLTSYWQLPVGAALERDPALASAVAEDVAAVTTAHGPATEPQAVLGALQALPATMRSSLQHDLDAGGPSELEVIGGVLLRRAADASVPVPALERVVGELRQRVTSTSR